MANQEDVSIYMSEINDMLSKFVNLDVRFNWQYETRGKYRTYKHLQVLKVSEDDELDL